MSVFSKNKTKKVFSKTAGKISLATSNSSKQTSLSLQNGSFAK